MGIIKSARLLIFIVYLSINFYSCSDLPDELIMPQWQVDLNIPLVNKTYTLSDILNTDHHISIDSTNNGSIYLLQSDNCELNSCVTNFLKLTTESSSLNNPVPASENDSSIIYVDFPDETELDSAVFNSGYFSISVFNPSAHYSNLFLRIPGVITPAGNEVTLNLGISPYQSDSINYNLTNHKYRFPQGQPLNKINSLQLIVKLTSPAPDQTMILVNLFLSDLYFRSVSGLMPSKYLDSRVKSFDCCMSEFEKYQDRVLLKEATLRITADYYSPSSNSVGFEIKNLVIKGVHKNGDEIYLQSLPENIYHTIKFSGTSAEKIYTEQNSNIKQLISFFPDTIIVSADYYMNPDNQRGTITIDDSIKFETNFSTRSYLALSNTNFQDQTSIDLSLDNRDFIKQAGSGNFIIELENTIPLAMWLKVDLVNAENNPLFTLTKNESCTSDSIYFAPAEVDENGEVIPSSQPIRVILNSSQVEMLAAAYTAKYSITVSTKNSNDPDPPIFAIRPSSCIKIKTYCTIKYNVNGDN